MLDSEHCYTLPEPSTSSISSVRLEFPGGDLKLLYDYDKDGAAFKSGLVFKRVRALSHVAESHCPAWKIEAAYDKLIKISDSELIKDLLKSTVEDLRASFSLNHYMIYFDSDGCYEIVAESWDALPEQEGSLS